MELAKYQQIYKQTVYDYLRENGDWPTYRQVEIKLLPTYHDFDVFEVAKSLLDTFSRSFFVSDSTRQASLSVERIHQCQGSEQDLANFIEVIRYCADKYIKSKEDEIYVSSDEVSSNLGMEDLDVIKVGLMIGWPIFTLKEIDQRAPNWKLTLSKEVIHFAEVKSIDDYLDRCDALRQARNLKADLLESPLVNPSYAIEEAAKADPSNIQEIAVSQLQIGNSYYTNTLLQSQQSFLWARIWAGIGTLFFIVTAFILLFRQPISQSYIGAIITALSGAAVEVIAGINLNLYGRASDKAASYHVRHDRIQRFLIANSACESLDEEAKKSVRADLIRKLVD